MGMFDNNADYGSGGYLRREGDYFLKITSVEYDDRFFPKYSIMAEVETGSHTGEIVQGQIAKPTEQYMNDNDRAIGGFSFAKVGAYVVGAGITEEVNALPKVTVGAVGKMLVGKTIKAHVQLTYKSQQAKDSGETTGLFYEIGRIYKRSEWNDADKNAPVENEAPSTPPTDADGFMNIPDGIDEELPFI